jgi:hypothetical protein
MKTIPYTEKSKKAVRDKIRLECLRAGEAESVKISAYTSDNALLRGLTDTHRQSVIEGLKFHALAGATRAFDWLNENGYLKLP